MFQNTRTSAETANGETEVSLELDSWMTDEDLLQVQLDELKRILGEETPGEPFREPVSWSTAGARTSGPTPSPVLDEDLAALLRNDGPQDPPAPDTPPEIRLPEKPGKRPAHGKSGKRPKSSESKQRPEPVKPGKNRKNRKPSERKSDSSSPSGGLILLILLELAGIGGIAAWWVHWIG